MQETLRPTSWDTYIGQEPLKERLQTHIQSAIMRCSRLDHILLFGPPGCGKTSLAQVIANEANMAFEALKCPIDQRTLVRTIQMFRGVLFLDEVHLLKDSVQNDLLMVLEDGYIGLSNGNRIYTDNWISVIGATTEPQNLIPPLYDRFDMKPPFDDYNDKDMEHIVRQLGEGAGVNVPAELAMILGQASGGIPRNARSLVFAYRDLMLTRGKTSAKEVLDTCRVTPEGLSEDHMRYLGVLADMGGVAGLDALSNHLRLSKPILMNLERLLVSRGFLNYTRSGRELQGTAFQYLRQFTTPVRS